MAYHKKIVCLAKSKKPPNGRCVAGIEVFKDSYGEWIRPVSVRKDAEISLSELRYKNGTEAKTLDIINIRMLEPDPRGHQTENHRIDAEYYWSKAGTLSWDDLADLKDTPATLWTNGDSTLNGENDRVYKTTAIKLKNSLYLIRPENVTIRVLTPGLRYNDPRKRVRAKFQYKSKQYDFMVTDPVVERNFKERQNGDYPVKKDLYFCVSLAEELKRDGYCYKLVAAIFSKPSS